MVKIRFIFVFALCFIPIAIGLGRDAYCPASSANFLCSNEPTTKSYIYLCGIVSDLPECRKEVPIDAISGKIVRCTPCCTDLKYIDNNFTSICPPKRAKSPDCKTSGDPKGLNYVGVKYDVTKTGRKCDDWKKHNKQSFVFPNETTSTEAKNYCRNPDDHPGGPWCYTGLANPRWEECDIPTCTTHVMPDCLPENDERGAKLHSTKYAYSKSGKRCREWIYYNNKRDFIQPKQFPDETLADAKNYCRNPDGHVAPWCYTDLNNVWEDCDIPECTN